MKSKFILALTLMGSTTLACFADGYMDGVEYYQAGQDKNAEIVLNQTLNDASTVKTEAYYYLGCIALNRATVLKLTPTSTKVLKPTRHSLSTMLVKVLPLCAPVTKPRLKNSSNKQKKSTKKTQKSKSKLRALTTMLTR